MSFHAGVENFTPVFYTVGDTSVPEGVRRVVSQVSGLTWIIPGTRCGRCVLEKFSYTGKEERDCL